MSIYLKETVHLANYILFKYSIISWSCVYFLPYYKYILEATAQSEDRAKAGLETTATFQTPPFRN